MIKKRIVALSLVGVVAATALPPVTANAELTIAIYKRRLGPYEAAGY